MRTLLKLFALMVVFGTCALILLAIFLSGSSDRSEKSTSELEHPNRKDYGINPDASPKDKELVLALVRSRYEPTTELTAQFPEATAELSWGVALGYPGGLCGGNGQMLPRRGYRHKQGSQ
jgi:hypothetical protein